MQQWKEPVMLTFIKLYKEHNCLWNRQNGESTRRTRATAWSAIAKQLSELHEESVTVMDCKTKMKCLMQKFQREKLKVLNGKGEDWPLYNELSFLEKSSFPLLKSPNMAFVPMLRARRRTRVIQRYPISATTGAPNEKSETKIVATPMGETKHTAKEPRNSFAARGKRRATEDIGRTLRNAKIAKLNTTDNGTYSLTTAEKRIDLKKLKKTPKYLNVNIIHSSTPEDHRKPVTPVSTPSDPCHTLAQDECQCFGTYIANKTRSYSACTRSAVQHAISEILFKADRGHYDRANSSVTVNTQTEETQSEVQQSPETMQLIYEIKSEELSDLDDEAILH